MSVRPPLAAIALLVIVISTGCVGVPGAIGDDDADGAQTINSMANSSYDWTVTVHERQGDVGTSERIEVEGDLPVNATRIFWRVERLLNASATAPTVTVENRDEEDRSVIDVSEPMAALGFTDDTGDYGTCGAIGSGSAGGESVTVGTEDPLTGEELPADAVELVLAHEYAHVIWQQHAAGEQEHQTGVDNYALRRAVVEGHAVAAAESYASAYDVNWQGMQPMELRDCLYRQSENRLKLSSASYYFGGQYYLQTHDGTGELLPGVEPPPTTTEQLIHPERGSAATPMTLSVEPTDSTTWETERNIGFFGVPAGEAALRVWLGSALDQDQVDEAATGWGNGTSATYVSDGTDGNQSTGTVWVLRWDTPGDATEFEDAAGTVVTSLESQTNTSLSLQRIDEDTVIVAGGPEPFVDGLDATGANGTVTLTPPGDVETAEAN